jgi:glycine cleavage system H protein
VGWPDFKSGGWCHASPGGFDSLFLPPLAMSILSIRGFPFETTLHYDLVNDMWCTSPVEGICTVGITPYGLFLSGELFMCRPKASGQEVLQGNGLGIVELAKSVISIKSPVSGIILEVNPVLKDQVQIIHQSPFTQGWLAKIKASNWEADCQQLVHGQHLQAKMEARMDLEPDPT